MPRLLIIAFLAVLATAKNAPLEMEIGQVALENLVPGKLSEQRVQFHTQFRTIPQVALTLQGLNPSDDMTFFSKIVNLTQEGFTIQLLSATEERLEFGYLAILDDRVQINCLNFKVKEHVFIPFKRQYQKQPRIATFLTGIRNGGANFTLSGDSMREGVLYSFTGRAQVVGLCVLSGTIDSVSFTDPDVPKFRGLQSPSVNTEIGISALTSFLCENQDECSLYFRNDPKQQQMSSETSAPLKGIEKSPNTEVKLEQDQPIIRKENTTLEQRIEKPKNPEEMAQEILKLQQAEKQNRAGASSVMNHLQDMIQKEIKQEEEQEAQGGVPIKDQQPTSVQNPSNSLMIKPNKGKRQKPKPAPKQPKQKAQALTQVKQKPYIGGIDLQNEFSELKQISLEQTKHYNISNEVNHDEHKFISFKSVDDQTESKGEQLVELKTFERAPKMSAKLQQLIEQAKEQYKRAETAKEEETSFSQPLIDALVSVPNPPSAKVSPKDIIVVDIVSGDDGAEHKHKSHRDGEPSFEKQGLGTQAVREPSFLSFEQHTDHQMDNSPQLTVKDEEGSMADDEEDSESSVFHSPLTTKQQISSFSSYLDKQYKLLEQQIPSLRSRLDADTDALLAEPVAKSEQREADQQHQKIVIQIEIPPPPEEKVSHPRTLKTPKPSNYVPKKPEQKVFVEMNQNGRKLESPKQQPLEERQQAFEGNRIQRSSLDLLDNFSEHFALASPSVQPEVRPRFTRLHSYVEKAEKTEIVFIQKPKEEEPVAEVQPVAEERSEVSYSEQLNKRKTEILMELKEKYKIKRETPIQESQEVKLTPELYPHILYEQYLDQVKKQTAPSFAQVKVEKAETSSTAENAYQLEAAFYEWSLRKEK